MTNKRVQQNILIKTNSQVIRDKLKKIRTSYEANLRYGNRNI